MIVIADTSPLNYLVLIEGVVVFCGHTHEAMAAERTEFLTSIPAAGLMMTRPISL